MELQGLNRGFELLASTRTAPPSSAPPGRPAEVAVEPQAALGSDDLASVPQRPMYPGSAFRRSPGGFIEHWFLAPGETLPGSHMHANALKYDIRTLQETGRALAPIGDPAFSGQIIEAIETADRPLLRALAECLRAAEQAGAVEGLGAEVLLHEAARRRQANAIWTLRVIAGDDYDRQQPHGPARNVTDFNARYPARPAVPLFDLAARDAHGDTALHHAVVARSPEAVTELCQFPGASPIVRNRRGAHPFAVAARIGSRKTLVALITQMEKRNGRSDNVIWNDAHEAAQNGETPLHAAVRSGSLGALTMVLQTPGVAHLVENAQGLTAGELALQLRQPKAAELIERSRAAVAPIAMPTNSSFESAFGSVAPEADVSEEESAETIAARRRFVENSLLRREGETRRRTSASEARLAALAGSHFEYQVPPSPFSSAGTALPWLFDDEARALPSDVPANEGLPL